MLSCIVPVCWGTSVTCVFILASWQSDLSCRAATVLVNGCIFLRIQAIIRLASEWRAVNYDVNFQTFILLRFRDQRQFPKLIIVDMFENWEVISRFWLSNALVINMEKVLIFEKLWRRNMTSVRTRFQCIKYRT